MWKAVLSISIDGSIISSGGIGSVVVVVVVEVVVVVNVVVVVVGIGQPL